MLWSNLSAVSNFFLNNLERLPSFIEAYAGPDAVNRLDAAISAETQADDVRTVNLNRAAELLDIAGEHTLAATVRDARPQVDTPFVPPSP